ncbi:hypothetical protein [Rubellimicrobium sp. CFH 75288]|uniref:hypothetical protein n=1 Tax=Rubellimicrobium sp. CFH 75288 TaxID=2697034 RepID=UPI001413100F|nr:hypothetical protein [Rubellimicrobium sp. CFH 75288]NAZ35992.1 hypothetical protein [Rubellimicrobium sp. CFH 75288]
MDGPATRPALCPGDAGPVLDQLCDRLERDDPGGMLPLARSIAAPSFAVGRTRWLRARLRERRHGIVAAVAAVLRQEGAALSEPEQAIEQRALVALGTVAAARLGAEGRHAEALARLDALPSPLPAPAQIQRVRCLEALGRSAEAGAVLDRLCERPDPPVAAVRHLANRLHWENRLETDPRIPGLLDRAIPRASGAECRTLILRRLSICAATADSATAAALLEPALSAGVPPLVLCRVARQIVLRTGRREASAVLAALPRLEAALRAMPRPPAEAWLALARTWFALDRPDRAAAALAEAAATADAADSAALRETALRIGRPVPVALAAPARHPLPEEPGWTSLVPDGSLCWNGVSGGRAVVAFDNLVLDHRVEVAPLDLALRERGVGLVLVRDRQRQLFIHGFGPFFPNRRDAEAALAAALSRCDIAQTATIGFSAGGYAALRYGLALGAGGAMMLSGLSHLPRPDDREEPRGQGTVRRVLRIGPPEPFDLLPLLRDHPDFVVHAHYPEQAPLDRRQAVRLADLPRARLFGAPHSRHMVWTYWSADDWRAAIGGFLDDLGWPA